jgi:quercetin dioxygenase-like cupin family protein
MITHHFSSNLYAKECVFPKGAQIVQHKHNYDHLSILAKGKVMLLEDDKEIEVTAPACINIKADKHHGVLALEECVWYCIHATSETDPNKVDQVLIKE